MSKPHALVTNDDGIDSGFLRHLIEALQPEFKVSVAAPASEQSWIGRAMGRHRDVKVIPKTDEFGSDTDSWAITGTPSDCVNIALAHLIRQPVDIVLSGINIGYNTTDTLILSSGTVAGAIEGALWDLPAIAFSQCIDKTDFAELSQNKGHTSGHWTTAMQHAAQHCRRFALDLLDQPAPKGTVININFPTDTTPNTPVADCTPAHIRLGSLYAETEPGTYRFQYSEGSYRRQNDQSDREVLKKGAISRSLLDFAHIGRPLHEWSSQ